MKRFKGWDKGALIGYINGLEEVQSPYPNNLHTEGRKVTTRIATHCSRFGAPYYVPPVPQTTCRCCNTVESATSSGYILQQSSLKKNNKGKCEYCGRFPVLTNNVVARKDGSRINACYTCAKHFPFAYANQYDWSWDPSDTEAEKR